MKTRNKILLGVGIFVVIIGLFSTAILYFNNDGVILESDYNYDPSRVLAHCAQQKYGEENNWKTPDGKNFAVTSIGLYAMNETHYIDNNLCTWIERPLGLNTMLSGDELKFYKQKLVNENYDFVIEQDESIDNFEKTWGGPGNRHPAFLGYDIPEICTEDMIKHLVKYSSMFERNTPYAINDVGLDDGIKVDRFDKCVEELLERNPKELENEN